MIELGGRTFRRHGDNRWQMDSELPEWGINITFDATDGTTWEWRMLAAALDEIERLTPENVEEPT